MRTEENRAWATAPAVRPSRRLSASSPRRRSIASARALASPDGTRSAETPSSTMSTVPGIAVATTGFSNAIASMSEYGQLSMKLGRATRVAGRSRESNSDGGIAPRNSTRAGPGPGDRADRVRDEEDVTDSVPIVELDRKQGRKHGQGRPLRIVQGAAVPDGTLDPASLPENRRVGGDDRRARRRIGPEVGHLGVVDDEEVRPVFADEIRPSSLEGPLEPVVVRHDAAPVREGHRAVAGVRRRSLAAEDRHIVSRHEAREELPEVRPDPAPDSPEFRGGHRDLRFLVPPVPGCQPMRGAEDLASSTSRNPNPRAPRASTRRVALLR